MESLKRENLFEQPDRTRRDLELPDRPSIKQIKDKYPGLSKIRHPDHFKDTKCPRRQQQLKGVYAVLTDYCSSFRCSSRKENVEARLAGKNFRRKQFGKFSGFIPCEIA